MLENELQGVMQVADRFHIHQNLLDAVKKALYKEMPESVVAPAAISDDSDDSSAKISEGKKTASHVDNYTESELLRKQLIIQIQQFKKEVCSISEIARRCNKDRRTITKYLTGDSGKRCRFNVNIKKNAYEPWIIELVQKGYIQKQIADILITNGYNCTYHNARRSVQKVVKENELIINKYCSAMCTTKTASGAVNREKNIFIEVMYFNFYG